MKHLDYITDIFAIIGSVSAIVTFISIITGLLSWLYKYKKNKIFKKILFYLNVINDNKLDIRLELLFNIKNRQNANIIFKKIQNKKINDILRKWEKNIFILLDQYLDYFKLKKLSMILNYYVIDGLKWWNILNEIILKKLKSKKIKDYSLIPYCKRITKFKKTLYFKILIKLEHESFSIVIFVKEKNNSKNNIIFSKFVFTKFEKLKKEFKDQYLWDYLDHYVFSKKQEHGGDTKSEFEKIYYFFQNNNLLKKNEIDASGYRAQIVWKTFCDKLQLIDAWIKELNALFSSYENSHYILYWKDYEQVSEIMKNAIESNKNTKKGI